MTATISKPGAISKVTSQFTAPSTIWVIRPLMTLRALSFISPYKAQTCGIFKNIPAPRRLHPRPGGSPQGATLGFRKDGAVPHSAPEIMVASRGNQLTLGGPFFRL